MRIHELTPIAPWTEVVVGWNPQCSTFFGHARGQRKPSDDWTHAFDYDRDDWDPQPSHDDGAICCDLGDPYFRILDPDVIIDGLLDIAVVTADLRDRLIADRDAEVDYLGLS